MAYDAVIGSVLMGVGMLGIGRAVIIVMRNETGRFPFDPAISFIRLSGRLRGRPEALLNEQHAVPA